MSISWYFLDMHRLNYEYEKLFDVLQKNKKSKKYLLYNAKFVVLQLSV